MLIRVYLIIGIELMMASTVVLVLANNELAQYQTPLGQLAKSHNQEIRDRYQMYETMQVTFAAAGVAGLVIVIYATVARDPLDRKQWQS